jgi:hypothetical protein
VPANNTNAAARLFPFTLSPYRLVPIP